MFRFALKELLAHKIRLVLTTLSVVVGVAFVVGSFVLTASVRAQFDQLFEEIYAGIDLQVRARQEVGDGPFGATPAPIPGELRDEIRELDGVAGAEGAISFLPALVIDPEGDPVMPMGGPPLGVNWSEVPSVSGLGVVAGDPPAADDEVAFDRGTFDRAGYRLGDEVTIQTPLGPGTYTLVGEVTFGESNALAGAGLVAFTEPEAQRLFGFPGDFQSVDVDLDEGVDADAVQAEITELLPEGVEVVTGDEVVAESQESLGELIGIFGTVLLAFAGITLFVSSFLISNTFTIVIGQRVRELALVRAIGASGRQVFASVLVEASVVGVVASVLGFGLGLLAASGINAVLSAGGFGTSGTALVIEPGAVMAAFGVGMVVTLASALVPARRATRVPPVAAMRDGFRFDGTDSRRRGITGGSMLGLGVLLLGTALVSGGTDIGFWAQLAGGAVLTFLGVSALSPLVAEPVARLLGAPLARVGGQAGRLARENGARNPQRTASTAAALMVGLALVSMAFVVGTSVKESFRETLSSSITADWYIGSPGSFFGFSPEVAAGLSELDELDAVTGARFGQMIVDGSTKDVTAVDLTAVDDLFDLRLQDGEVEPGPNSLLVHSDPAEDLGLTPGDRVTVTFDRTGEVELTVTGIHDDASVLGNWVIGMDTFDANFTDKVDLLVAARTAPDVTADEARAAIEGVLADFPQVEVQDRDEYVADQEGQLDQLLLIVNVFLAMAIVIAFLGIMNTLALSVFERTREIGLLRAVGMGRRQVRRMVRFEAVIVALFGAFLGVGVGLAFGLAVTASLPESFITTVAVPWGQLASLMLLAVVLGVVAAFWPALRASRMDVLRAITVE